MSLVNYSTNSHSKYLESTARTSTAGTPNEQFRCVGVEALGQTDRQISWSTRYIHFLPYSYTPEQNCVTWSWAHLIAREPVESAQCVPRPPESAVSVFGDIHGKSELSICDLFICRDSHQRDFSIIRSEIVAFLF